jgi:single-stranded-DNA-specific exonuclease
LKHFQWHILPPAPPDVLAGSGMPHLLIQLLFNRGITVAGEMESFFAADARLSHDPLLLPDMETAVIRIYRALLAGEKIAVYGDYDVDGISATAIMVKALESLGGVVTPYIPNRLTEGYGLNFTALDLLKEDGVSLIITVDTGITAIAEVAQARKIGIEVIVTDHHTPLPELPAAAAIINPKRPGSNYPFKELAGAGVAYKLSMALFHGIGKENGDLPQLVDLAALGTIADIAPLTGENRYIVTEGLKQINRAPRPGLTGLAEQAGLDCAKLSTDNIAWQLTPRLNAAGRLADAMNSYQLLMTDSPDEARELAAWLDEKNAERQRLTVKVLTQARNEILAHGISPLLISGNSEYPAGITGLAASRLTEEFYRPVILISTGEITSSGSCRSVPEFNIIKALSRCGHLLTRFGGHSQAAGFSLPTGNLPEFTKMLSEVAATELTGLELFPHLDIDAEVKLAELGGSTYNLMQKLAPFGHANPVPTFLSRRVRVVDCRTMGREEEHLRLRLRQDGQIWEAVAFRQGDFLPDLTPFIDIVYNLEIDHWRGDSNLRLNVLDFAESNSENRRNRDTQ